VAIAHCSLRPGSYSGSPCSPLRALSAHLTKLGGLAMDSSMLMIRTHQHDLDQRKGHAGRSFCASFRASLILSSPGVGLASGVLRADLPGPLSLWQAYFHAARIVPRIDLPAK